MKLETFSYQIVVKTLEILEGQYHYKIPEKVKKEVAESVIKQLDSFIEA